VVRGENERVVDLRQVGDDLERELGEGDVVRAIVLRLLARDRPGAALEVEFRPGDAGDLSAPLQVAGSSPAGRANKNMSDPETWVTERT